MEKRLLPLAASLSLVFPVSSGLAATTTATETSATTSLTDIVVSARPETEWPAARLVEQRPLGRASTADTASLLGELPGVALQGGGGAASLPVVRGLADDRNRIKLDGMDLIASCPNHMNPPLSYLAPGNLGSLKLYAGIAPVSLGGDSIGSTIVAESAAPEFAGEGQAPRVGGQLGAYYRSNGDGHGAELAASYATATLSLGYHGAAAASDNLRAGGAFKTTTATGRVGHRLPTDEIGSTAYDTRNHALSLAWRGDGQLFEARLGYQDVPEQNWPNQRMDMLGNEAWRLTLRHLGEHEWGFLETRVYREDVDHFMDFGADKRFWYGAASGGAGAVDGTPCAPIGPSCAAGMPMHTESSNTGVGLKAEVLQSAQATLRLGGEFQQYRLDDWWPPSGAGMAPDVFWNVRDGRRDRSALFVEHEAQADAGWATLVGARYEQVRSDAGPVAPYAASGQADADRFNARDRRRTDHNLDLAALARFTPDDQREFEVGLARKVRSPSLYERYTWRARAMEMLMINWVGDGNGYLGDPELEPEKAATLSAAFDWHAPDRRWSFRAAPYFTEVRDYIDAVRCPTTLGGSCTAANLTATDRFVLLQFANQSARLYGLDLSGRLPLARNDWGAFGLQGVLSYVRGRNTDTGDGLYNVMPLNARLSFTQRQGGWDNAVELVVVAAKHERSAVRNEIGTPSYELVNLRARYAWRQMSVDFAVDNVFDTLYYAPLGGAYNGQGTTMTTSGASSPAWGVAVPGSGRSFNVAVNLRY